MEDGSRCCQGWSVDRGWLPWSVNARAVTQLAVTSVNVSLKRHVRPLLDRRRGCIPPQRSQVVLEAHQLRGHMRSTPATATGRRGCSSGRHRRRRCRRHIRHSPPGALVPSRAGRVQPHNVQRRRQVLLVLHHLRPSSVGISCRRRRIRPGDGQLTPQGGCFRTGLLQLSRQLIVVSVKCSMCTSAAPTARRRLAHRVIPLTDGSLRGTLGFRQRRFGGAQLRCKPGDTPTTLPCASRPLKVHHVTQRLHLLVQALALQLAGSQCVRCGPGPGVLPLLVLQLPFQIAQARPKGCNRAGSALRLCLRAAACGYQLLLELANRELGLACCALCRQSSGFSYSSRLPCCR